MTHRFPLVLALAATALCLVAMPGEAAGRKSGQHGRHTERAVQAQAPKARVAEPKAAEATTERTGPTGVWTSGEQERACFRSRRKLWQAGQGWVVKRVSVCP